MKKLLQKTADYNQYQKWKLNHFEVWNNWFPLLLKSIKIFSQKQTPALNEYNPSFSLSKHHQTHLLQVIVVFIGVTLCVVPCCTLLFCGCKEGKQGHWAEGGGMTSAGDTKSSVPSSATVEPLLVSLWCYKVMLVENKCWTAWWIISVKAAVSLQAAF